MYIQSVVTRIFSRMQAGCAALGTLRRNLAKLLLLLPLALILAAALSFGYDVAVSALKDVPQAAFSLRRTALFSPFTYFLLLHIIVRPRLIYSFCFRYRYLLAVLVFALCVVFELHGSSIGMYDIFIQPDAPKSSGAIPILGEARTIRADEWLKFTSMSLSQEFNNYAAISPITEAWPTSMVTLFGQPAWDLSTLAKPQFWGYLLFGSAKGLAWFWMGRLIALFLISFEFLRIFTNDNKYLSLTGAFLIALSPVVQWWYVMPHLTDILQSCFLAIILVHLLLKARQNNTKIACKTIMSIALGLCACGFILSLYPAWMIPAAYLFVLLMIIVICRTIRSLSKDARLRLSDFAYLAVAIAVAVVIIG
ncbi:MAG: hypothetical protein LBG97_06075, partial [Coriobacteriales bacterium]|nr:hypothetical protein [Coriobacteriales bacterium]